jgi:multicomponent Na+:H+ antiporter subunit D
MSAVYLIAVPLLAAFLSILSKKVAPYLLLLVSILSVVGIYFLVPETTVVIGGFEAPYGIELHVTNFSIAALFIVDTLFFVTVALTISKYKELSSVLLVTLAGLNGLLLTADLFNLFVFLEITGISAYLITTTNKKPLSTFNYLVAGTVGSSFYLLGLIILYNMVGTLAMVDLHNAIDALGNPVLVSLPILFMFIGLGVEAKLLPFNAWVKSVLGQSNTLSGTLLASVFAAAMGLTIGRLLSSVFVFSQGLETIVLVIIVLTILAGEAMAYASSKLREILLFSSIAQAGIAVSLFFVGLPGFGLLLIGANAVSKFVLFFTATHLAEEVKSDELDDLQGVFDSNKVVGATYTVASLSVLGLPLFVGFVIKLDVLKAFFDNDQLLLPGVILVSSLIEGVYYIKMLVKLWYKVDKDVSVSFDITVKYVFVVIAIALIFFGLVSGNLLGFASNLGGLLNE